MDFGLKTISEMSAEFGVSFHNLRYLIETNDIAEARRAGRVRLFDQNAVTKVASLLSERKKISPIIHD
jgi:DNA-binding transcriptional MerR regulator